MGKLKHVAITSQTPRQTTDFYKEAFDLDEIGEIDSELVEGFFLSDGHVNLAILKFKDERVAGPEFGTSYSGLHHIGFEVDDLVKTAQKLEKLNSKPRDDINSVLNPAMVGINEKLSSAAADMAGDHSGSNVELKFGGPDGVMFDISHTGWSGTSHD